MNIFSRLKDKISSKKDSQELQLELLNLLRRKFNLYTQFKMGQLKQTHVLKEVRRDIARIKYLLLKDNKKV